MKRKRILFVDDEQAVLDGLRVLLRKEQPRWDMAFAVGAEQALAELRAQPVDVIVADMCMPGMDGAALLAKVKDEYPGVARIVLSGHMERAGIQRALPVAHQYLSKPCEAGVLRAVIERSCELHRLLEDQAIRRVVGKLGSLPSAPRTYKALLAAASDENAGIRALAEIVESDPAMSAKVLQLTNSAYFGCAQRVVSVHKAVGYLGIGLLKGLALTAQVFSAMEARPLEGLSLDRLQADGLLTARLAKRLLGNSPRADEAFTAGLVHDIGKIVLALGLRDELASVVREAEASGQPFHVVEQELLGVTHAEIGAYLLGVWGLPFSIVEAVAYHHRPDAVSEGPSEVLAALHAAEVQLAAGSEAAGGAR